MNNTASIPVFSSQEPLDNILLTTGGTDAINLPPQMNKIYQGVLLISKGNQHNMQATGFMFEHSRQGHFFMADLIGGKTYKKIKL